MKPNKILPLADLAEYLERSREDQKVVLCHGTFDLVHMGHIRYFQRAKREGDILIVTITGDAYVNKGPGRPVFSEQLRLEALAALECVDHAAVIHEETGIPAIEALRPDVYAKGSDYKDPDSDITGNIRREQVAVERYGGRIFFSDEITFSSSELLNSHFDIFPPEVKTFVQSFRSRMGGPQIVDMLTNLKDSRVLVVGETIIDEYHYTTPMGQTGKGYTLAVKHNSVEQFAGGSLAVANHLAGLSDNVTILTGLGRINSHEGFIRERLNPTIKPAFFYSENGSTLVKSRFVDGYSAKLFEVYYYKEETFPKAVDVEICKWLDANLDQFDAVVVPDFGHGFISENMIDTLCRKAKFLAVNTQVNSGNRGYHTIKRYPRVDFASLNQPELRLAARNRTGNIEDIARQVGNRVQASYVATTMGPKGLLMLDRARNGAHRLPALSTKVVDQIGAGDAFLSFSSLCLANGFPADVAAFVGSVAAAINVQTVCNREPVNPIRLFKSINTLLK